MRMKKKPKLLINPFCVRRSNACSNLLVAYRWWRHNTGDMHCRKHIVLNVNICFYSLSQFKTVHVCVSYIYFFLLYFSIHFWSIYALCLPHANALQKPFRHVFGISFLYQSDDSNEISFRIWPVFHLIIYNLSNCKTWRNLRTHKNKKKEE